MAFLGYWGLNMVVDKVVRLVDKLQYLVDKMLG